MSGQTWGVGLGANRIVAAGVGESLSGAEGAGVVCGRDSLTGAAGWGLASTADIVILNLFWGNVVPFHIFSRHQKIFIGRNLFAQKRYPGLVLPAEQQAFDPSDGF